MVSSLEVNVLNFSSVEQGNLILLVKGCRGRGDPTIGGPLRLVSTSPRLGEGREFEGTGEPNLTDIGFGRGVPSIC